MNANKAGAGKGAKEEKARALWFTGPRVVELREEVVPPPGPGEITVAADYSLVSAGSEMRIYRGDGGLKNIMLPTARGTFPFPVKFAYETVGRVVAAGEGSGYDVGNAVFAAHPHQELFTLNGAFCVKAPKGLVDLRRLVFMSQLGVALCALDDVPVRLGELVVVSGLGLIGSFCAYLARKTAWKLVLIDPIPKRRAAAGWIGADAVVDPKDAEAVIAELGRGLGVDTYYEASGAPAALQMAINTTRVEGTIVAVGWYGTAPVPLILSPEFHVRRLRIVSSQNVAKIQQQKGHYLADVLTGFDVRPLITHEIPFDRASDAYALIDQHPAETLGVLLTYSRR